MPLMRGGARKRGGVMTTATIPDVRNAEQTPRRTVRVSNEVWDAAAAKAEEKGETVSDVVRRALIAYARRK